MSTTTSSSVRSQSNAQYPLILTPASRSILLRPRPPPHASPGHHPSLHRLQAQTRPHQLRPHPRPILRRRLLLPHNLHLRPGHLHPSHRRHRPRHHNPRPAPSHARRRHSRYPREPVPLRRHARRLITKDSAARTRAGPKSERSLRQMEYGVYTHASGVLGAADAVD